MSKLKALRVQQNLTQEELSEKSSISVRTIQRIEAGTEPKGHTLRLLAETLAIPKKELLNKQIEVKNKEEIKEIPLNYSLIKLVNLSSIPFIILPPLNILLPLILMFVLKLKNPITKKLISLQIMWTILAPIVFMLGVFLKLGNKFTLIIIIVLVLSNLYIILRNAKEIDNHKKLYYSLNFSMI